MEAESVDVQQTHGQALTGTDRVPDGTVRKPAPPPVTAKAKRTRQKLLAAARAVFERDGFFDARVADIAAEAGVSHGTFYNYFDCKTDVFRTVVAELMAMVYDTRGSGGGDHLTTIQRIERGNRQFIRVYREHGAMLGLMEQVATFDEELRTLRVGVREQAVARARRSIERLQREHEVSADLDAGCAARALVSMVSNFVYFWLILGEGDHGEETAVHTLTRLWASALGLAEAHA